MEIPEKNVVERVNTNKVSLKQVYHSTRYEELIPHPPVPVDQRTIDACAALHGKYVAPASGNWIPDDVFTIPKWVFLDYLVRSKPILLHGSNAMEIAEFEPRSATDNIIDGHQPRIHAASSAVMACFYAICSLKRVAEFGGVPAMGVAYMPWVDRQGIEREGYQFALDYRALPKGPWVDGALYILPRKTFTADYMRMQWFSEVPVIPLAKIRLAPRDFPLLDRVRGINWDRVVHYTVPVWQEGYPWLDDPEAYPEMPDAGPAGFEKEKI